VRRAGGPGEGRPRAIGEALAELLKARGLDDDVARAWVLEAWAGLVGTQIAAVTEPRLVAEDGTLVVGVRTHGWMTELAMMERTLVSKINAAATKNPVKRIRWELQR
jgi:predicted nucleic acid-binding Zn ribbon protein